MVRRTKTFGEGRESPIPRADLVTVAEPEDSIHRAVIESALEEAGIPFLVQNAEVQDLFGAGRIGGFNLLTGPIKVRVEERFADAAIEVLQELEDSYAPEGAP